MNQLFNGSSSSGGAGAPDQQSNFLSDWKSYAQQAQQALGDIKGSVVSGTQEFTSELGAGDAMGNLKDFGKSLSGSISSGFSAIQGSTGGVDLSGVKATFSSAASSAQASMFQLGQASQQGFSSLQKQTSDLGAQAQQGALLAFDGVQTGATTLGTHVVSGAREFQNTLKNLSHERVAYFFALSFFGGLMLFLAFFIGIPTIALAPAKFAICFSVGSVCTMTAVGALRGPMAQINHMVAPERLLYSASYVGSLLGTLYCSVVMHSYIFTILFTILQLVSLVYYQVSYFPMGTQGLKIVVQIGYNIAKPFVYAIGRCLGLVKPKTLLPL